MPVNAETIKQFFVEYGWQVEFEQETETWRTGFRGDTSNFHVVVHLTEDWLYFAINPFVNAAKDARCAARLHHYLLRLNHAINMAKFSVDADGDIVLTVELPTENIAYSEFADGLNAISYYADGHYLDVLNLAQDPDFVPVAFKEEGEAGGLGGGQGGGLDDDHGFEVN
jgi:hypothetical protein